MTLSDRLIGTFMGTLKTEVRYIYIYSVHIQ